MSRAPLVLVCALALAISARPARAQACSGVADPIVALPAFGQDIPIDHVLVVGGLGTDSLDALLSVGDAEPMPITLSDEDGDGWLTWRPPDAGLAPSAEHVLRVTEEVARAVGGFFERPDRFELMRFTTSDRHAATTEPAWPDAYAVSYGAGASCDSGACCGPYRVSYLDIEGAPFTFDAERGRWPRYHLARGDARVRSYLSAGELASLYLACEGRIIGAWGRAQTPLSPGSYTLTAVDEAGRLSDASPAFSVEDRCDDAFGADGSVDAGIDGPRDGGMGVPSDSSSAGGAGSAAAGRCEASPSGHDGSRFWAVVALLGLLVGFARRRRVFAFGLVALGALVASAPRDAEACSGPSVLANYRPLRDEVRVPIDALLYVSHPIGERARVLVEAADEEPFEAWLELEEGYFVLRPPSGEWAADTAYVVRAEAGHAARVTNGHGLRVSDDAALLFRFTTGSARATNAFPGWRGEVAVLPGAEERSAEPADGAGCSGPYRIRRVQFDETTLPASASSAPEDEIRYLLERTDGRGTPRWTYRRQLTGGSFFVTCSGAYAGRPSPEPFRLDPGEYRLVPYSAAGPIGEPSPPFQVRGMCGDGCATSTRAPEDVLSLLVWTLVALGLGCVTRRRVAGAAVTSG